jgi:hypothetical protein
VADDLIRLVRAADLTPTTELTLVYRLADERGEELPPVKFPFTPTVTVRGPTDRERALEVARKYFVEQVCRQIDDVVRNARADAPVTTVNGKPAWVVGFALEIADPGG